MQLCYINPTIIHSLNTVIENIEKKLSCRRGCVMLHVTENFAKLLKVT